MLIHAIDGSHCVITYGGRMATMNTLGVICLAVNRHRARSGSKALKAWDLKATPVEQQPCVIKE